MARESQGLQVLLIVFVMLSVVLGVSLYLYVKKLDEATKSVASATTAKQTAEKATDDMQKERDVLKILIGFPDRSTVDIQKQFGDDMDTYGNEPKTDDPAKADDRLFPKSSLYYSRLLASMFKVIQDRNVELADTRAQVVEYGKVFKNREEVKTASIDKLIAGYQILDSQNKTTSEALIGGLNSTQAASAQLNNAVTLVKTDAAKAKAMADDIAKNAQIEVQKKEKIVREVTGKLNELQRGTIDVPRSGEIIWVSIPTKTVWINRGQADYLQRGTKFTIYSADSANTAKAVNKGSVEVTKIEGAHSAQARIVDDKLADPIMMGDKVFTPLWSPGQQNHFALTGIMNLDGDGVNQVDVVRGMIKQSGGIVDCELSAAGQKVGAVLPTTRYVVVGDAPDKSSQELMKNHGDILREADRYHIQAMTLSDFKQQMGYQKSSLVEHFGTSAPSGGGGGGAPSRPAPRPKAPAGSVDAGG